MTNDKAPSVLTAQQIEELIRRSAEVLAEEARCLHDCHTFNGEWGDEADAKDAHDEMLHLATGLNAALSALQEPDRVSEALRELVRLEYEVAPRINNTPTIEGVMAAQREYSERIGPAWEAARQALTARPPDEPRVGKAADAYERAANVCEAQYAHHLSHSVYRDASYTCAAAIRALASPPPDLAAPSEPAIQEERDG